MNLTIVMSFLKKTSLTILLGIRYAQFIDILYLPFGSKPLTMYAQKMKL